MRNGYVLRMEVRDQTDAPEWLSGSSKDWEGEREDCGEITASIQQSAVMGHWTLFL